MAEQVAPVRGRRRQGSEDLRGYSFDGAGERIAELFL
jgi:hypothetical protein